MNDLMPCGCMHALQEAGLRIPEGVAVAGFDNREITSYLHPPLTTVRLPTTEIDVRVALHIMKKLTPPSGTSSLLHCGASIRLSGIHKNAKP